MLRSRFTILPSPARSRRFSTIRSTSLADHERAQAGPGQVLPRRLPWSAPPSHPIVGNEGRGVHTPWVLTCEWPAREPRAGHPEGLLRSGSAEPDHAVVEAFPPVDHAGPARFRVVEEVEIVADQLHLVESLVHRHGLRGVLLLANDAARLVTQVVVGPALLLGQVDLVGTREAVRLRFGFGCVQHRGTRGGTGCGRG